MKKTLLELVTDILNDMDSDEVNSIDDTVESLQVAQIVKSSYLELMSNRNWPHMKGLIQFDASNDLSKPVYLKLPENVKELTYFAYDKTKTETDIDLKYREIKYLFPDQFLRITSSRNLNTPNTRLITDFSGAKFVIQDNKAPTYWTSFDDEYIVCDSFDSTIDDTLQTSKTQAFGVRSPTWETRDDFVPDLPEEAFALLQEESKSTAFFVLKQMANDKAEQKSKRQNVWLSRKAWKAKGGLRYMNYGRRGKK